MSERIGGRSLRIGAWAGLLYALTLSRDWSGDSIAFALAAEGGGLWEQLEPHALLLPVLARAAYVGLGWLLPEARAMLGLGLLNALAGGIVVGCAHAILLRQTGRPALARWGALALAVSNAAWLLSSSAEMVTPALALAMLSLAGLLASPQERWGEPRRALLLGLIAGLAALATQSHLLLLPAMAAAWWLAGADRPGPHRRALRRYLLGALGLWLPIYAASLIWIEGIRGWADLRAWRPHPGLARAYGLFDLADLPHAGYAFLRSLVGFPGLGLNDSTRALLSGAGLNSPTGLAFLALYAITALCVLLVARLGWHHRRASSDRHMPELAALGGYALLQTLFAIWWLPGDLSFWLPVTVALWLVAGLVFDAAEISSPARSRWRAWLQPSRSLPVLAGSLLLINGLSLALPNRLADRLPPAGHPEFALLPIGFGPSVRSQANVEASLMADIQAEDLVIVIDDGRLFARIYYLSGGRASSPFQLVPGHPLSPEPPDRPPRSRQETQLLLASMVDSVRDSGGRLYLVGLETAHPRLWDRLAEADIDRELFEPYVGEAMLTGAIPFDSGGGSVVFIHRQP